MTPHKKKPLVLKESPGSTARFVRPFASAGVAVGMALVSSFGAPSLQAASTCALPQLLARPGVQAGVDALRRETAIVRTGEGQALVPSANVGDTRSFQVYNFQTGQVDEIPCILKRMGDSSLIWVDVNQTGSGKVSDQALDTVLEALEQSTPSGSYDPGRGILAIEQEIFGLPPDLEGTGKLNVVIVDIQDGWSQGCGCPYTAGFFDPNDLNLSSPTSNAADILYIDAYPSLYTAQGQGNPNQVLNTVAHEYQHLLHAANGNLYLFQNEGQSEWAQGLTGYPVRSIQYLDLPGETNQPLYSWRSGTDVALDYQRASLFHSFLAGQVGPEALGSVSGADQGGWSAYADALGPLGRAEALTRFHLANWLNDRNVEDASGDTPYFYADSAHSQLEMRQPTLELNGGETPTAARAVAYGGAEYLRWLAPQDLAITLTADSGMRFAAITSRSGVAQVEPVTVGEVKFSGTYDSVVLVALNVESTQADERSSDSRTYQFSSRWIPGELSQETLNYADPANLYYAASLPYGQSPQENGSAVRFTPGLSGKLLQVKLGLTSWFSGEPNPAGTGSLRIALTDSELLSGSGSSAVIIPGDEVASITVPFESLTSGPNLIDVSSENWTVVAGEDFHLVLTVENPGVDSSVAFDLDSGSKETANPAYYPARTRRDFDAAGTWAGTWQDNGNIAVGVTIEGTYDHTPGEVSLIAPAEGSSGWLSPLLSFWYPASGAQRYDVQVDDAQNFSSPILSLTDLTNPWAELEGLTPGTQYYWRVRGVNSTGAGDWSAASFTLAPVPDGGERLEYVDESQLIWSIALPFGTETRSMLRFSPLITGEVEALELELSQKVNGGVNPSGNGELRLSLHTMVEVSGSGAQTVIAPDQELGFFTVNFDALEPGVNRLPIPETWEVDPETSPLGYGVVLEVVNADSNAAVGVVLDNGSTTQWDQDYYPARTRRYFSDTGNWNTTWLGNGNISLTVEISGDDVSPTQTPSVTPTPEVDEPTTTPTQTPDGATTPTPTPESGDTATPEPSPAGDDEADAGGCACSSTSTSHPSFPLSGLLLILMGLLPLRRVKRA